MRKGSYIHIELRSLAASRTYEWVRSTLKIIAGYVYNECVSPDQSCRLARRDILNPYLELIHHA